MSQPTQETLLIGDFYDGAYGPTILLALEPGRGAIWFHGLLSELVIAGQSPVDLAAAPEAKIDGIDSFNLRLAEDQPAVALRRVDLDPSRVDFEWTQSASGWSWAAALVESFVKGGSGHHYLSLERHDAALVEVSFREDLPLSRSFGGSAAPSGDNPEAGRRQTGP